MILPLRSLGGTGLAEPLAGAVADFALPAERAAGFASARAGGGAGAGARAGAAAGARGAETCTGARAGVGAGFGRGISRVASSLAGRCLCGGGALAMAGASTVV